MMNAVLRKFYSKYDIELSIGKNIHAITLCRYTMRCLLQAFKTKFHERGVFEINRYSTNLSIFRYLIDFKTNSIKYIYLIPEF